MNYRDLDDEQLEAALRASLRTTRCSRCHRPTAAGAARYGGCECGGMVEIDWPHVEALRAEARRRFDGLMGLPSWLMGAE